MKLTRKHIGLLVDNGGDGSWVYQLVAVNKTHLLFYDFHGDYYKERRGKHSYWRPFAPTDPWPRAWVKKGWQEAKEDKTYA